MDNNTQRLNLKVLGQELSVCKVAELTPDMLAGELYFVGKTDEELSLVCETAHVPTDTVAREDGWRAFRIEGVLDFSLTGILAKLSAALADAGIGIFAVSTYNTDYILVKQENLGGALQVLEREGYGVCA